MPFVALTCQPEELAMLQRVYNSILKMDWFDRTEQNERTFARIVIGFFQRGITDEELLFVEANSVARSRLSLARTPETTDAFPPGRG